MALRLVAACQLGKDPSIGNIALTDPVPVFTGIDPAGLDGRGKWAVEKDEQARYEALFQVRILNMLLLSVFITHYLCTLFKTDS